MGIPGIFGGYFQKNVGVAISNQLPLNVSSLAFDLNGVLHKARLLVYGDSKNDPEKQEAINNADPAQLELQYYNAVSDTILTVIAAVLPQDCLILAVDGVAPGAKMQQQRSRREAASKERFPNDKSFDRNAITPGTDFMIRLDNYLTRFITTNRDSLPPKVIYSSHLVPGEGEHKIMDLYRKGELTDGRSAKDDGCHVLYGLDADLIMLSLLSPLDNIFLSRESVDEFVSIQEIKNFLIESSSSRSAVRDFVFMMFLVGNDFIPHSPVFQDLPRSVEKLFDIYSKGNYIFVINDENGKATINWNSFQNFLSELSKEENNNLASLSVQQIKFPSRFLQSSIVDGQFYPGMFRSKWYDNALGPKGNPEFIDALLSIIQTYEPTEDDISHSEITSISTVTGERITKMVVDYMRTMEWIYLYYNEGTDAVNLDWAYPYYHAPLLSDLSNVMQFVNQDFIISGHKNYPGMVPFTILHQLVATMPIKSKNLLPEELHVLFSYNSLIRDLFPDNFIVEMDGVTKDYKGILIIPIIDRQRIFDAVAQIPFSINRLKLWQPTNNKIYIRSQSDEEFLRIKRFNEKRHHEFLARQLARKQEREAADLSEKRSGYKHRGSGTRGYAPRGSGTRGYAPRGSDTRGYAPRGSGTRGYAPRGSDTRGYAPRGSGTRGYAPRGSDTRGYAPRGSDTRGYAPRGSRGFTTSGADPRGSGIRVSEITPAPVPVSGNVPRLTPVGVEIPEGLVVGKSQPGQITNLSPKQNPSLDDTKPIVPMVVPSLDDTKPIVPIVVPSLDDTKPIVPIVVPSEVGKKKHQTKKKPVAEVGNKKYQPKKTADVPVVPVKVDTEVKKKYQPKKTTDDPVVPVKVDTEVKKKYQPKKTTDAPVVPVKVDKAWVPKVETKKTEWDQMEDLM